MSGQNQPTVMRWTRERAALLAVVCLAAGIAGGWSIHGLKKPPMPAAAQAAASPSPINASSAPSPSPGAAPLQQMADTQAAPLLEKLKADPRNPDLLIGIGNLYYDAQQYPTAVDYYARALQARPSDAAVRTDMGTAYWYMGNADLAISEFNKALTYAPDNANTLFNLGLVKWKGKRDAAGALANWKQLLAANPNYDGRNKVQEMMAEVLNQQAGQPKTKAN